MRAATDLPDPLPAGPARTIKVELEAVELVGKLASETTYVYWTFNGKVPGPFLRVRVGVGSRWCAISRVSCAALSCRN